MSLFQKRVLYSLSKPASPATVGVWCKGDPAASLHPTKQSGSCEDPGGSACPSSCYYCCKSLLISTTNSVLEGKIADYYCYSMTQCLCYFWKAPFPHILQACWVSEVIHWPVVSSPGIISYYFTEHLQLMWVFDVAERIKRLLKKRSLYSLWQH